MTSKSIQGFDLKDLFSAAAKLLILTVFCSNLFSKIGHAQQNPEEVYVQVQSAKVRKDPRQWAKAIADLKFADQLTLVDSKDGWFTVKTASGVVGYVHSSAVTTKKVILSGDSSALLNTDIDAQSVYLAGKGFNDEVLKDAADTQKLNLAAVDTMVANSTVDADKLEDFIQTGELFRQEQ